METRSWATRYRGPLAIHAGKVWEERDFDHWRFRRSSGDGAPYAMHRWPESLESNAWSYAFDVPLGAVVATARLVDCVPILGPMDRVPTSWLRHVAETLNGELRLWNGPSSPGRCGWEYEVIEAQRPYGDFTPGRYAWLLADIERLPGPVPAKGKQGVWEWEA